MKVYLNAGHDRDLDSGAVNADLGLRECDAAYELTMQVKQYLERNGMESMSCSDRVTIYMIFAMKPTTPMQISSYLSISTLLIKERAVRKPAFPARRPACFSGTRFSRISSQL